MAVNHHGMLDSGKSQFFGTLLLLASALVLKVTLQQGSSWASADFFPGEGKIFQGGGKNILFA